MLTGCTRRERLPGESKSGSRSSWLFYPISVDDRSRVSKSDVSRIREDTNVLLPISCRRSPIRRMACGRTRLQALSPAGIDVPLTCTGLVVEDKPVARDLEFYIIRVCEYGVIRFVGGEAGPSIVVQQVGTPLCYRMYGLNFIFHVRDDIT